jgi:hypothetical protein
MTIKNFLFKVQNTGKKKNKLMHLIKLKNTHVKFKRKAIVKLRLKWKKNYKNLFYY